MAERTFTQPDRSTQSGSAYRDNIDNAIFVLGQLGQAFAPHEKATPDLTVLVDAAKFFLPGDSGVKSQNQQTVSGFTATGANLRIDRIVYDEITGAASRIAGTESASPSPPGLTPGKRPICQVGPFTTSTTAITNSMITDERAVCVVGGGGDQLAIDYFCGGI